MKRIGIQFLSGLLCCFFLLTMFRPISVYGAEATPKIVRVGFFEMDGYHMQDESGHRSGYGYEFLQKIGRYLPYRFEYVGYGKSWNEMLEMLENGEIDILTPAAKTPDREEQFEYSRNTIGTNYTVLVVKEGNKELVARDYATYNGMKIGLLNSSTNSDVFKKYAQEKGFTYVPVYFEGYSEMEQALQDGLIDGIVSSNLRDKEGEYILDYLKQSTFYVIAPRGNRTILDEVDYAIDELDFDEPGWRTTLMYQSYYSGEKREFSLHSDEKAFFNELKENNTIIKVLMNPDRKPYSYFVNGKAKGIIPAIFAKLADTVGFSYEILETKNRAEYNEVLKSGVADVCMDILFDYSDAEDIGYKLTGSYMATGIARLTRKNNNGEVQSISITDDPSLISQYRNSMNSDIQFKQYDSLKTCVDAVKMGEVDATFLYTYTAQEILNQDYSNKFLSQFLNNDYVYFAIGVNESCDCRLLKALNRAVINIGETDITRVILESTDNLQGSDSIILFLRKHPAVLWTIVIVVGLFFIVAGIAVTSYINQLKLKRVNEQLNKANNAKRDFLAKMSHDMRTPMNAIIGFTNMALKQNDLSEVYKCLDKISSSSEHLLTLINDVLDMSSIEGGATVYHPVPTNLCDVTESVLNITQGFLTNRKLTLHVERPLEEHHCCVLADGIRIREILVNLLSNAVKFTPDGGTITFSMGTKQGADDKHITIWYRVADTGCGMSEEFLPCLFDEFSQEEKGARTQYKGSGLGMAITRHYVDMMGGIIKVTSKKEEGTTFYIELPVEKVEGEVTQNSSNRPSSQVDLTGKRILLAEDNELNAEIAIALLEEVGLKITRAEDGEEAVELFATSPVGTFDVILMDIMMPKMNGYEATKAIRNLHDRPDGQTIPIIAMTANAFAEDIQTSLDAGMNGHIAKPIDTEKLMDMLMKLLK